MSMMGTSIRIVKEHQEEEDNIDTVGQHQSMMISLPCHGQHIRENGGETVQCGAPAAGTGV